MKGGVNAQRILELQSGWLKGMRFLSRASQEQGTQRQAVVLIERGEVLPRESEESAEVPVHRDKRRADDQLQGTASRQRGEFLPRSDPCAAHGSDQTLVTRGELLPQDAKALETDSETEQEPPALSSLTSSATPWKRRVKKREEREPSRGSEAREPSRGSAEVLSQPAVLHGMATIRGVPRDILSSLPKELAYEWQEGPTGGLAGTRLVFLARGGDKMVFEAEEMLLKLSTVTQYWEIKFSQLLPKITAKTHWQERVQIRLHQVRRGSGALPQYVHVVPGQSASGFRASRSQRRVVRLPLPRICGVLVDLRDVARHHCKGYGRQQYRG